MAQRWVNFVILLGLGFGMISPVLAQPANLEGKYEVRGTNPGGTGSYRGTVDILKVNDKYVVHWEVGNSYTGVGIYSGHTFIVDWGNASKHLGTVSYLVSADGSMKGTWFLATNPKRIGTETLTPVKSPWSASGKTQ